MDAPGTELADAGVRQLIEETCLALARLDAGRLEELALACQALSREMPQKSVRERAAVVRAIYAAAGEMEMLGRVLEATRGNLRVMRRLRDLRAGAMEYSEGQARGWAAEAGDGHH